jgi:hypothetical protein
MDKKLQELKEQFYLYLKYHISLDCVGENDLKIFELLRKDLIKDTLEDRRFIYLTSDDIVSRKQHEDIDDITKFDIKSTSMSIRESDGAEVIILCHQNKHKILKRRNLLII